jgi:AcrR family transcriptional regulator
MVETRPRNGAKTNAEIREAAAALFYEHGYEATSLRTVAAEVGIKVGSLYNHIGSKDDLLLDIMLSVQDTLLPMVDSAVEAAGDDPVARLEAAIGAHIRFHATNARETFIGNSEIRSLNEEQQKQVLAWRKKYENLMKSFIQKAADAVEVELIDLRLQTYALLALGMHTASWFREAHAVPLDRVVNIYTELSLRQLGISRSAS